MDSEQVMTELTKKTEYKCLRCHEYLTVGELHTNAFSIGSAFWHTVCPNGTKGEL